MQTEEKKTCNMLGGFYSDLLFLQPFYTRRKVAQTVLNTALKAGQTDNFTIDSVNAVSLFLGELCDAVIRDQYDGCLFGSKLVEKSQESNNFEDLEEAFMDWEDIQEEQNSVAKLIHYMKTTDSDPERDVQLLSAARIHLGQGGQIRIRFTLPALVTQALYIARLFIQVYHPTLPREPHIQLLQFIHKTILSLSEAHDELLQEEEAEFYFSKEKSLTSAQKHCTSLMPSPEMALRLFLQSAQVADEMNQEELAYEFVAQALVLYEDFISESKAQMTCLILIMGNLQQMTVFGYENLDTLLTKCVVLTSRLLKRADQARGLLLSSYLFWGNATVSREKSKPVLRDSKKVMQCLQRALKISTSVMDKMIKVELLIQLLDVFVWHFEQENEEVILGWCFTFFLKTFF
jgi:vacuolar protein sorting-associated protein 35